MSETAGITENRTLLEKADVALSDLLSSGGLMVAAQAAKFIRLLIDDSVIMKMATVVPMRAPTQLIEKIRFGSRILRPGVEAQPLAAGDRVKPDLSKVELSAKLFKAEIRLDNEVLEDNIERDQLRNTVLQMLGERIALDMDEVILKGDTASVDLFLATLNGIIHEASYNLVDALDTKLNKAILRDCLKTMPTPFLRNPAAMKFLTSIDAEIDYRDSLADRVGALADVSLTQREAVPYSGVAVQPVPMMPENVGTGTHCTYVLFCDPKNINVGIWRQIRLETDKDISAGVLKIVATLRFDVKWAERTAVVKASNVKVV
jgi:hypothetical protein